MSKHTPGPWASESFEQVAGNGVFYGGLIVGDDGETVVAQCVMAHNARLIAAAPDLLEALKAILSDGLHCDVVPHLHEKARAAIAKAEGSA
jgi:hypothetical protein